MLSHSDKTTRIAGKHAEQLFYADPTLVQSALSAAAAEKELGFKKTFRLYYKAALWSMALSLALVMEGYDVGIVSYDRLTILYCTDSLTQINSFWGQASFLNKFGSTAADGTKYIPANWQAALNNATSIGQMIGLAINGWVQPKFGSKKVYLTAMAVMVGTIFLPVFSTSLPMLFGGEILCGIPWGIFRKYIH